MAATPLNIASPGSQGLRIAEGDASGAWTGVLPVDPDHPFYFDHPVDHVPGSLLVAGLLDLAANALGAGFDGPGRRLRLALAFTRFVELDAAVTLFCDPDGVGRWTVGARQGGAAVCEGTMSLAADPGAMLPTRVHVGQTPAAAPAELVHRKQADSVMVGPPGQAEPGVYEAAVLSCPTMGYRGPHRAAMEVIESARQYSMMLGHVVHEHSLKHPMIWMRVGADLPTAIPRGLPLVLRWHREPPDRGRARYEHRVVAAGGGPRLGTVEIESLSVPRPVYERIRAASGDAGR